MNEELHAAGIDLCNLGIRLEDAAQRAGEGALHGALDKLFRSVMSTADLAFKLQIALEEKEEASHDAE